jgi:hypothetical protein
MAQYSHVGERGRLFSSLLLMGAQVSGGYKTGTGCENVKGTAFLFCGREESVGSGVVVTSTGGDGLATACLPPPPLDDRVNARAPPRAGPAAGAEAATASILPWGAASAPGRAPETTALVAALAGWWWDAAMEGAARPRCNKSAQSSGARRGRTQPAGFEMARLTAEVIDCAHSDDFSMRSP